MTDEPLKLPYTAQIGDLHDVADYLRSRPTGATIAQVRRALGNKLTDDRKIGFYELTGFVSVEGGRWRLTSAGSEYIHSDDPTKRRLLRKLLRSYAPYHEILSWIHHQGKDTVTADEVRLKWANEFTDSVSVQNKDRLSGAPLTLFGLCQHAGLGQYLVGRRGASSRLEVDLGELKQYHASSVREPTNEEQTPGLEPIFARSIVTDRKLPSAPYRASKSMAPEFAFPLSNNMTISVRLPDEIPSGDAENLKTWFNLMLKTRTKTAKSK